MRSYSREVMLVTSQGQTRIAVPKTSVREIRSKVNDPGWAEDQAPSVFLLPNHNEPHCSNLILSDPRMPAGGYTSIG